MLVNEERFDTQVTIEQMHQMNFTGNVIPHIWYSKIKLLNGNPDLLGIIILAEICYWYRPTEIRDELTGKLVGVKKKFAADMLQRSLSSFEKQFGATKKRVAEALKRLEALGLIVKERRTIETAMGRIGNVLFLAPVVSKLREIQGYTQPCNLDTRHEVPSYPKKDEGSTKKVGATTEKSSTYTKITTEISTEKTAAESRDAQTKYAKAINNKSAAASLSEDDVSKNFKTGCLKAMPEDNVISDVLSEPQLKKVYQIVGKLKKYVGDDSERLIKEIQHVLLSPKCFTYAGNDFAKKLNTIQKAIRSGGWTSPTFIAEKKKKIEQEEINPILQKKIDAEQDVSHWQRLLQIAVERNETKQKQEFKLLLDLAMDKLKSYQREYLQIRSKQEQREV